MILEFNKINELANKHYDLDLDLTDISINDAIIKRLNRVQGSLDIVLVDNDSIDLIFDVTYNVDYLDARTLEPLVVDFALQEDIMLTDNQVKAEDLDIDYINEEIDVKTLVSELILVNIPFNYSQAPANYAVDSQDDNTYQPFVGIFGNKEE